MSEEQGADEPLRYVNNLLGRMTAFGQWVSSEHSGVAGNFRLIVTTCKDYLRGGKGDDNVYVGSCNLGRRVSKEHPENTVYLHPYFFELSDIEQLKILHYLIISKLQKRIENPDEAMRDTEMYVDYFRSVSAERKAGRGRSHDAG